MSARCLCAWILLPLLGAGVAHAQNLPAASPAHFRVLSWNVSDDAFVAEERAFQSLLSWADPDIVLLDEVTPSIEPDDLGRSLTTLRPRSPADWEINVGASGGRQRCVIASRWPQERVPEFAAVVPYPDADRQYLQHRMSASDLEYANFGMDGGIPVNAAVVLVGGRRLLTVIADLQCCGGDQDSWQEYRRRAEVREIRRLVRQVLRRTVVDGVVVAGDLNVVNGPLPLVLLAGPYTPRHPGLIAAEVYQPDGLAAWTWDGRRTPFPSSTLDYQLYDPRSLAPRLGLILDTEHLLNDELTQYGLDVGTSATTGRHRPLVVDYGWTR